MKPLMNTIATVLTAVFAVAVVALLLQILYVIWRRRRFTCRSLSSGSGVDFDRDDPFYTTPSKELLYFFCWKNQANRVEPHGAAAAATAPPHPSAPAETEEVLKWQGLYGPSRVLFTIREEDMEADDEGLASSENEATKSSVCVENEVPVAVADTVIEVETTPFSTPCASPPYYTPSPSPPRNGSWSYSSADDDGVVSFGRQR